MTSQIIYEIQSSQNYICAKGHIASHENKGGQFASTFSSPPMGRDENVLKCSLLIEFNNDFDSYKKGF